MGYFLPSVCAFSVTSYSLLLKSHTSNAGGQDAYSLRRSSDETEWNLFINTYLLAGNEPLVGATYNKRYAICGHSCFWQFYVQAGIGGSTAGPVVELLWGTVFLWVVRIDIATQIYITRERAVFWSYPAWVGLSMPLF